MKLVDEGKLFMRVNDATLSGTVTLADSSWHHVTGGYDGSELLLYVDGVLDTSATIGSKIIDTTADLLLGQNFSNSDSDFSGRMDEVKLYDNALNSAEVSDLLLGAGPAGNSGSDGDWVISGDNLISGVSA